MTREEAIERFNGIINAMSISIAQSKFYPSKAELDELCDMAIEALSADAVSREMREPTEEERASVKRYIDSISADVVAVVRCKDCRQYIPHDLTDEYGWCCEFKASMEEDDFCSHGERKNK